jgi:hypothetical protein
MNSQPAPMPKIRPRGSIDTGFTSSHTMPPVVAASTQDEGQDPVTGLARHVATTADVELAAQCAGGVGDHVHRADPGAIDPPAHQQVKTSTMATPMMALRSGTWPVNSDCSITSGSASGTVPSVRL